MNAIDDELLSKIKEAVVVANAAQAEHVSRSKELGLLLLKARRRHPTKKDFEKFLKPVVGLGLSRAYELLRLAGGRVTEEELRKEARDRQAKSRARRKRLPPPPPQPEPAPAVRDVTDTSEAGQPSADNSAKSNSAKSAKALAEFRVACLTYWPGITEEADQQKARAFVDRLMNQQQAEAA
jgi:hypothetical protein